jgi:hypothetical protein
MEATLSEVRFFSQTLHKATAHKSYFDRELMDRTHSKQRSSSVSSDKESKKSNESFKGSAKSFFNELFDGIKEMGKEVGKEIKTIGKEMKSDIKDGTIKREIKESWKSLKEGMNFYDSNSNSCFQSKQQLRSRLWQILPQLISILRRTKAKTKHNPHHKTLKINFQQLEIQSNLQKSVPIHTGCQHHHHHRHHHHHQKQMKQRI